MFMHMQFTNVGFFFNQSKLKTFMLSIIPTKNGEDNILEHSTSSISRHIISTFLMDRDGIFFLNQVLDFKKKLNIFHKAA